MNGVKSNPFSYILYVIIFREHYKFFNEKEIFGLIYHLDLGSTALVRPILNIFIKN